MAAAKFLFNKHYNDVQVANRLSNGILIGGMTRNEHILTPEQSEMLDACFDSTVQFYCNITDTFKSLWKPNQTTDGIVYRKDEHVIVTVHDEEIIICIAGFFCIPVTIDTDEHYKSFVEGKTFSPAEDEQGEVQYDPYSGSLLVKETVEPVLVPVNDICRKVILFPNKFVNNTSTSYIVIDYQRCEPPVETYSMVVPFFPRVNDMVEIQGDDDEVWLGHIQRVLPANQTVKVIYYVQDNSSQGKGLYVRYTASRHDAVAWASIIGLAVGHWVGTKWSKSS